MGTQWGRGLNAMDTSAALVHVLGLSGTTIPAFHLSLSSSQVTLSPCLASEPLHDRRGRK